MTYLTSVNRSKREHRPESRSSRHGACCGNFIIELTLAYTSTRLCFGLKRNIYPLVDLFRKCLLLHMSVIKTTTICGMEK